MAYEYRPPLAEMRFVIEQVLQAPAAWARCPAFAEVDIDTAAAVLEEAAPLCHPKCCSRSMQCGDRRRLHPARSAA